MRNEKSNIEKRISVLDPEPKFSIANSSSTPQVGWHPADVKAALEKRGLTMARLSREAGYSPTAVGRALRTAWPAVEMVIAEALGTIPQEIWPERYDSNGIPLAYKPRVRPRGGTK